MPFDFQYDPEQLKAIGRQVEAYRQRVAQPSPLLESLATSLADEWRRNIDAGPNDRWEAGASIRATAQSGTTLKDKALMYRSISGGQIAADAIAIGSALTVGEGRHNLLAIHEFGATINPKTANGNLRFRLPFLPNKPWITRKTVRIPARPTAPFDWTAQDLTPAAQDLVRQHGLDYLVELGDQS